MYQEHRGGFGRKLAIAGLAAALFGTGYCTGIRREAKPPAQAEALIALPPAPGFLDLPGTYSFRVTQNAHGERETYLRNNESGMQWQISDATPRLLDAYAGNGRFVMEGAIRTVRASRWAKEKLEDATNSGFTYAPDPVPTE